MASISGIGQVVERFFQPGVDGAIRGEFEAEFLLQFRNGKLLKKFFIPIGKTTQCLAQTASLPRLNDLPS